MKTYSLTASALPKISNDKPGLPTVVVFVHPMDQEQPAFSVGEVVKFLRLNDAFNVRVQAHYVNPLLHEHVHTVIGVVVND
jgi:hypothetical protein